MTSSAKTVGEYVAALPDDRRPFFEKLRETVLENIPEGFEEAMGYGMPGWEVPKSLYPPGYHCDPKQPLPFAGMAQQKHGVSFYHMGIYADPELLDWFRAEWPRRTSARLDMGKSCIRLPRPELVPLDLLGELMRKMSVEQWVAMYEAAFKAR